MASVGLMGTISANRASVLVFVLCLDCAYSLTYSSVYYYPNFGHDLASPRPSVQSLVDKPPSYCAYVCSNDMMCGGFNYRWPTSPGQLGECEVLEGKPHPSLLVANIGITYYENMYYDECLSIPCQNGGSCTDGYGTYSCVCAAGFQGSNCEINIDECSSAPCQHGSTCVDGVNGYICQCVTGFSGTHCDICPVMKMGPNCDQDCTLTSEGREFNGTTHSTVNGRTCQRWDENWPHIHSFKDAAAFPDDTLADAANYCRNPDPNEPRLWCYTIWLFHRWEYCNVPMCP